MSALRCYAPVVVLVLWAITWQAGLSDTRVVPPWLTVLALAVVVHIREEKRSGRWHVHH